MGTATCNSGGLTFPTCTPKPCVTPAVVGLTGSFRVGDMIPSGQGIDWTTDYGYTCRDVIKSVCSKGVILSLPTCRETTMTETMTLPLCPCVHGSCIEDSCCPWKCKCHSDPQSGFWQGEFCEDCQPGYYGSECKLICPTGICNPCSSNGKCDDGISGTGLCTCHTDSANGYWSGVKCDSCLPGWGGHKCDIKCPDCALCNQVNATCICDEGENPATDCKTCLPLFKKEGSKCITECPSTTSEPCSGNGVCNRDATCTCQPSFWGNDCASPCLCMNGGNCSSTGICTCPPTFEGTICEKCIEGFWGVDCENKCDCSDHGPCDIHGTCSCNEWWSGPDCSMKCPGLMTVCSGNGKCKLGKCTCNSNIALGMWTGDDCDRCEKPWYGSTCSSTCNSGAGCGANGVCHPSGECVCNADYCGDDCSLTYCDPPCPVGTFGKKCKSNCKSCVNGACSTVTGTCLCAVGWVGDSCQLKCPLTDGLPCGGPVRGKCQNDGTCSCNNGWGGPNCMETCLDFCSGRGACGGTPPTCTCDIGWGAANCTFPCDCGNGRCGGPLDQSCICAGNFIKDTNGKCTICRPGMSGPNCDIRCVNGITNKQTCECDNLYSGVQCNSTCPLKMGKICSGRGVCVFGTGLPESYCSCEDGWYGAACDVKCTLDNCRKQGMANPQCGVDGGCECQDNNFGHYSGNDCSDCHPHYWGVDCSIACDCSGHGTCSGTSTCTCYRTRKEGFWDGAQCQSCLDGYIGLQCTQKRSPLIRVQQRLTEEVSTPIAVGAVNNFVYVATLTGGVKRYNATSLPPVAASDVAINAESGIVFKDSFVITRGSDVFKVGAVATKVADVTHDIVDTCVSGDSLLLLSKTCKLSVMSNSFKVAKEITIPIPSCSHLACNNETYTVCGQLVSTDYACVLPNRVYTARGTLLKVGMNNEHAVVLSKSDSLMLHELSLTKHIDEETLVMQYAPETATMSVDPDGPVCYVFVQVTKGQRSVAYKVLLRFGIYGELKLKAVAGSAGGTFPEVVSKSTIDAERKILYGAPNRANGLLIFLLYEANELDPPLADERGGTEVQILGRGFYTSTATCKFEEPNDMIRDAVVTNGELMSCLTYPVSHPKCDGGTVDISFDSTHHVQVLDKLKRYIPPLIASVEPKRVSASFSSVVSINISSFKLDSHVTCAFYSNTSIVPKLRARFVPEQADQIFIPTCKVDDPSNCIAPSSAEVYHVRGTLENNVVKCRQPILQQKGSRFLDIAMDGQVYTGKPIAFAVIGEASDLYSEPLVEYKVGNAFPDLETVVVDNAMFPLRDSDTSDRLIVVCEAVDSKSSCLVQETSLMTDGFLSHEVNVTETSETGAVHRFYTFTEKYTGWSSVTHLIIRHGDGAKLAIIVQPSDIATRNGPLEIQPIVELLDIEGNRVVSDSDFVTATVEPFRAGAKDFTATLKEGVAKFQSVLVLTAFGVESQLLFQHHDMNIQLVVSHNISAPLCDSHHYQLIGTTECKECSIGGICNGSEIVLRKPGYWRADPESAEFYNCISDSVCLEDEAHLSAAGNEQCVEGSGGALCQGCETGWARARGSRKPCEKCDKTMNLLTAILVPATMLLFAVGLVIATVHTASTTGTVGSRIVIVRSAIIFLQVLGKFGEFRTPLPEPLFSILYFFSRISLFDLSLFQPFNCIITSYFPMLEIYVLWPVIGSIMSFFTFLALRCAGRSGYSFKVILATSLVTSFFLCYSTLLTHLLAYQKCDTFNTRNGPIHRLWVDMSIDCEGDEYQRRKKASAAFVYILGVITPLAILVCYKKFLKGTLYLIYATGGFKFSYWWLFLLIRQIGFVSSALYVTDFEYEYLQHYIAMWVIDVALVLQYYFSPFESPIHNKLELIAVGFTTLLMNISCLFFVNDTPGWAETLLAYLLSIGCIVVLLIYIYYLLDAPCSKIPKKKKKVIEDDTSLFEQEMIEPVARRRRLTVQLVEMEIEPSRRGSTFSMLSSPTSSKVGSPMMSNTMSFPSNPISS